MEKRTVLDGALFLLRGMLGIIFVFHGLQKLGVFGGSGIEGLTVMVKGLNFYPPHLWAWTLALSETVGGVFLIAGLFPRIAAGIIAVVMLVAITKIHGAQGFFAQRGGCEYQLLILTVSMFFMVVGAGKWSVHNKL